MSEQRETASVKSQRHWTPTERETLIECGYIDFLPESYKIPAAMWAGRRPEVHRGHLKTITQLSLIQGWMGLTAEQWTEQSFRDSIRARYAAGDRKTIELLSIRDRRDLSQVAQELVRKKIKTNSSTFEGDLHFAMQERGLLGTLFRDSGTYILVNEYVRSLMTKSREPHPWLNAPLSQGGLFDAIFDRAIYFSSFKRGSLKSPALSKHLRTSDGTLDAIVGQLIRDLMEVEDWTRRPLPPDLPSTVLGILPVWRSVSQIVVNKDFLVVSANYSRRLKIPGACFRRIEMAFVALAIEELDQKWSVTSQSVFLAAAMLKARHPRLFEHYRTVLQGFNRQIVEWKSHSQASDPIHEVERRFLRLLLDADPLLRIVFHSEVLEGKNHLGPKNPVGAPHKRAKRLTAAVAARILHPYRETISGRTVTSMFQSVKCTRRSKPLAGIKGTSYYQHLAALLNILFADLEKNQFTAKQIPLATKEFGEDKAVVELSEDPGPAFVAALRK